MSLAISERGMKALRKAEQPDLLQSVISKSVPIQGRMIHGDMLELPGAFDTLKKVCDWRQHCPVTLKH